MLDRFSTRHGVARVVVAVSQLRRFACTVLRNCEISCAEGGWLLLLSIGHDLRSCVELWDLAWELLIETACVEPTVSGKYKCLGRSYVKKIDVTVDRILWDHRITITTARALRQMPHNICPFRLRCHWKCD